MTQERRRTPRTSRLAGRPVQVLAAAAVLLTSAAIAVGQSFGLQAATPAPTLTAPSVTSRTTSAPAGQRAAAQPAAAQPAAVQRVAATDVSTPSSSATPTPTSTGTPVPSPTPSATASTPTAIPTPADTPAPTSPVPAPSPSAPPPSTPSPTAPAPLPSPSSAPVALSPGLFGGPAALATLGEPGSAPTYLPAGQPLTSVLPFQTLRIVVQLGNGGPGDVAVAPRLEYRTAGTADFLVVPPAALPGIPLHAAEEWVKAKGGTQTAPESTTTTPDEARLAAPDGAAQADGHRLSGAEAATRYPVQAGTVTEQEFTVALSIDAPYGATYELRVTDGGAPIAGADPVSVTVADPPPVVESPGQQQGSPSGSTPASAKSITPGTQPAYRLVTQPPPPRPRSTSRTPRRPSPRRLSPRRPRTSSPPWPRPSSPTRRRRPC